MARKLGGKQLFKQRQASKKLTSFNSKWKPGDKLRAFYPCFKDEETGEYDLLCGAVWGYPWDCKASSLKRVFIPTTSEIDEYGDPVSKDALGQAIPILRLVFEGQKQEAINKIQSNTRMPDSAKTTAITQINDDFKKKQPLAKPLDYKIFTECYVVPMTPDDKPDWKNAGLVSQDLSMKRYSAIVEAMNNKANCIDLDSFKGEDEIGFFEISYAFKSDSDKSEAGDITPIGCPKEIALCYAEEGDAIKEEWVKKVHSFVSLLPDDSEVIIKRNSNSKPVPEAEIIKAISDYCATNYSCLDALAGEDVFMDKLDKQIEALSLFKVPITIPSIVEKIDEYEKSKAEEASTDSTDAQTGAPTVEGLQEDNKYTKEELNEIKQNATEGLADATEEAGLDLNAGVDVTEV